MIGNGSHLSAGQSRIAAERPPHFTRSITSPRRRGDSSNASTASDVIATSTTFVSGKRKIVRASGRDTGDNMKLSRDKITEISHKIINDLKKSREVRLRKDTNEIRLAIVKAITEILVMEEKAERASRDKIRSQKRFTL